jgi:predicted dehydrogenase
MFDNENIDILSVCTPTNSHLEIVKQVVSIESLKAIFIEKPMGGSVEEAHEIVKLCKDSGIILAVNYMRRWENKYRLIRSLIDNNSLGELYSITAYGCTALLTSTSHLIDIFLYYGGDIDWLIGRLQKDYIREVQGISDEGGFAFVKFKDGAFGFLKGVSKDPYNYMFEIDLLFSNGRATISKDGTKINIEEFILNYKSSGSEYKTLEKVESNKFKTTDNERMLDAVSDIIQSIKTGEAPHSDGLNAIEVHRFIQAIKDSDNQGNKIIYE